MTKEEIKKYLSDVQELIANNRVEQAIDLLLEFCDLIEKRDIKNDLLLLSGRLNSNENRYHIKEILELDDYKIENNRIKNALLSIISSFEDEDENNLETIGRSNGKLIHNTPSKMKLDKYYIASVRIAKDTVDITEDFKKSENSEIKTLLISPTMSISLIDITGGSVFDINFIGENREQRIHEDSFTEWRFSIKPKEKGVHTIQLCANFIEIFNGQKSYKTAYFESIVTIISEEIPLETDWKDTSIKIVRDEKDMMVPPVSGQNEESNNTHRQLENTSAEDFPSEMNKTSKFKIPKFFIPGLLIAAASLLILFVAIPFLYINYNSKKDLVFSEDSVKVGDKNIESFAVNDLKLELEQDITANLVIVNKDTIVKWEQINDEGTLIAIKRDYLPKSLDLPTGTANILVVGEKGRARGEFKLNLTVDSIYNLQTMLRDSSVIKILSKDEQKILFNGIYLTPDSSYASDNHYVNVYNLKNGKYKVSTEKQENTICKSFEILIRNDSMINLECKIVPRLYKCSLRFPFENPKVSFNDIVYKSTIESTANVQSAKGWIYSHKVKKGEYELKVIDPKEEYICETKKISVTNDVAIAIKCTKKVRYLNPTLRLPNGGIYSKDEIIIVLGNNKIDAKASIDKKDLVFTLTKIEEGSHGLFIDIKRNKKSILKCPQQALFINSNKEYIIKDCKETAQESSVFDPFKPQLYDVSIRLKDGKKYVNDNISIILDGNAISAGARYEKNDMILELKNLKKGAHKISINIIRKKITILSCINQQIIAGDKKEYIFEGCKEK
ncbi:MAG: hypothetical protein IPM42_16880 [Saprospiraceae bacterium]|nr:hypothetical protein [Saprospiraceae bacterium]